MPANTLDVSQVTEMLVAVADAIIAAEPLLSQADRDLGDGDHGIGMARGFNAVKEKLATEPASIDKAFSSSGMAMISSMGGASGAIFGTLFRDGGKALKGVEALDGAAFADFVKAGTDGVQTRGGAKAGDKTCVDALLPAAEAAAGATGSLAECAAATAKGAADGREASKAMIATMGRAKTLGERSVGFPDAGACSIAIIFETMNNYIANS